MLFRVFASFSLGLFFVTASLSSCSDDSTVSGTQTNDTIPNDTIPATFTELYDGVVWLDEGSPQDVSYFASVQDKPRIRIINWDAFEDRNECYELIEGVRNSYGDMLTVIENNLDNIVVEVESPSSQPSRFTITLTVTNNGNNGILKSRDSETGEELLTINYVRSSTKNPCL